MLTFTGTDYYVPPIPLLMFLIYIGFQSAGDGSDLGVFHIIIDGSRVSLCFDDDAVVILLLVLVVVVDAVAVAIHCIADFAIVVVDAVAFHCIIANSHQSLFCSSSSSVINVSFL